MFSQINREFHKAIRTGDVREVQRCLDDGAKIEQFDGMGFRPLIAATNQGQIEVMRVLIAHGADVNATNMRGFRNDGSATICAAKSVEAAKLLVDNGLHLDGRDHPQRETALNSACRTRVGDTIGCDWLVALVLDRGVSVDEKTDSSGRTALFHAWSYSNIGLVELLLARGARVDLETYGRRTVADYARQRGDTEIVALLENAPPADRRLLAHWVLRIRLHVVGTREHLGSARRGLLHRPLLCTIASFLIGPIRPFSS